MVHRFDLNHHPDETLMTYYWYKSTTNGLIFISPHLFEQKWILLTPDILIIIMNIGTLDLGSKPLLLAPMEDVTDVAFRMMCKRFGADMVYTEFVSSDALIRHVNKTKQKLHILDEERPVAIQIYGHDPVSMAEAAQICEEANPDVLDINFGCPVKKVAGKGAGAGLLRDIPKMLEITRCVVDAVKIPVTAKTRLGWDNDSRIIVDLAESLQDCGIAAIAIHGRTRSQMYTGEADWSLIGEVKNNPRMHIPVIGNGDINSPEICRRRFDETGVDAVMIGRGSIGRPWIFEEIKYFLENGNVLCPYPFRWQLDILKQQVLDSVRRLDERRGIIHIRRHIAATPIFKGIANFRETRIAMLRAETIEDLFALFDGINPDQ
jgi:tRNA-dihydrouridine synthase B